jgi:hypothetical protein
MAQTESVHFIQIWVRPDRIGCRRATSNARFRKRIETGSCAIIASPEGRTVP